MDLTNVYTLDTEFIEDGTTIELISIGIVRMSDNTSLYCVSSEYDKEKAQNHPFVSVNVLPYLGNDLTLTKQEIKDKIQAFITHDTPVFWISYGSYDWIVLCQIFGTMMDLPENYPKYFNEIEQEFNRLNLKKDDLPKQSGIEHNALQDALHNANCLRFIANINPVSLSGAFTKEELYQKFKQLKDNAIDNLKENKEVEPENTLTSGSIEENSLEHNILDETHNLINPNILDAVEISERKIIEPFRKVRKKTRNNIRFGRDA